MDNPVQEQRTIYFARMPREYGEDQIKLLFQVYGHVEDVVTYKTSAKAQLSKGCGHVVMVTHEAAVAAMTALDGKRVRAIDEAPLSVRWKKGNQHLQDATAMPDTSAASSLNAAASVPVPRGCAPDAFKLYIGNIPSWCKESDLISVFQPLGAVVECAIMRDRVTHESQGCGFLWFEKGASADAACKVMNLTHCIPDPSGEQPGPLIVRRARMRSSVGPNANGKAQQGGANAAQVHALRAALVTGAPAANFAGLMDSLNGTGNASLYGTQDLAQSMGSINSATYMNTANIIITNMNPPSSQQVAGVFDTGNQQLLNSLLDSIHGVGNADVLTEAAAFPSAAPASISGVQGTDQKRDTSPTTSFTTGAGPQLIVNVEPRQGSNSDMYDRDAAASRAPQLGGDPMNAVANQFLQLQINGGAAAQLLTAAAAGVGDARPASNNNMQPAGYPMSAGSIQATPAHNLILGSANDANLFKLQELISSYNTAPGSLASAGTRPGERVLQSSPAVGTGAGNNSTSIESFQRLHHAVALASATQASNLVSNSPLMNVGGAGRAPDAINQLLSQLPGASADHRQLLQQQMNSGLSAQSGVNSQLQSQTQFKWTSGDVLNSHNSIQGFPSHGNANNHFVQVGNAGIQMMPAAVAGVQHLQQVQSAGNLMGGYNVLMNSGSFTPPPINGYVQVGGQTMTAGALSSTAVSMMTNMAAGGAVSNMPHPYQRNAMSADISRVPMNPAAPAVPQQQAARPLQKALLHVTNSQLQRVIQVLNHIQSLTGADVGIKPISGTDTYALHVTGSSVQLQDTQFLLAEVLKQ